MSEHKKTITAIAWSRESPDIFASSSVEKQLVIWNVHEQCVLSKFKNLKHSVISIEWCPHESDTLSFMSEDGPLSLWNYKSGFNIKTFKDTQYFSYKVTSFKWNTKIKDKVCFGHSDGSLSICCAGKKISKHILRSTEVTESEDSVVNVEWDPLSTDYLLVLSKHSGIRLVDAGSQTVINKYKLPKVSATIRKFCWISSAPGMFISAGMFHYYAVKCFSKNCLILVI